MAMTASDCARRHAAGAYLPGGHGTARRSISRPENASPDANRKQRGVVVFFKNANKQSHLKIARRAAFFPPARASLTYIRKHP
ncbi:hypothetical protein [Bordetella genomosp. 10]|uniref:hypothetical protein n=1 Tax=Bordetella genomosp. 10 TaxID=1416804 RepID=UPI001177BCBD|nr:hypothetical protein [Bordetella genomosp. 10]